MRIDAQYILVQVSRCETSAVFKLLYSPEPKSASSVAGSRYDGSIYVFFGDVGDNETPPHWQISAYYSNKVSVPEKTWKSLVKRLTEAGVCEEPLVFAANPTNSDYKLMYGFVLGDPFGDQD